MDNKNKGTALNMTTSGREKSYTEVVYNNLIDYMEEKGLAQDAQIEYLKNSICYIEYENSKRKIANKIGFAPSILLLLGSLGAYYTSYSTIAGTLAITSAAFALMGTSVRLFKKNPYDKAISGMVVDVKQKEDVYRKVAPFIK